jgi:hypothetical protein
MLLCCCGGIGVSFAVGVVVLIDGVGVVGIGRVWSCRRGRDSSSGSSRVIGRCGRSGRVGCRSRLGLFDVVHVGSNAGRDRHFFVGNLDLAIVADTRVARVHGREFVDIHHLDLCSAGRCGRRCSGWALIVNVWRVLAHC